MCRPSFGFVYIYIYIFVYEWGADSGNEAAGDA